MKLRNTLKNIQFEKIRLSLNSKFTVQTLINVLTIIVGSFLFSIGVNSFMIAGNLGEGGFIGISIILYYAFGLPTALTNLIMNFVILIVGFKFLGKRAMYYTIFTIPMTSLALWITETWQIQTDEILINTVFGGLFIGTGIGLIIRVGSTTAGTTILAKMANKFLDVNVSYALLFFDLIVITIGLTVMSIEQVLLTVIALYVATKVMDFIIEGMNPKKAVTIISQKPDAVANLINTKINRGVTILDGRGYYSKEDKDILFVVINKSQLNRLKRLIKANDDQAFVVVHDVNSVLGNYLI
ncbi:YitT family protein [Jeotgalicoccus sp. ATCC 8456]|uniref:YitT family protein n=1 Tax=Jeotgalicoccus sp. ATCC 8456 TaxID=946435 RepID=UPI0018E5C7E0|nr:YitT family protein [Jeotgalicoccus sp. ATCC 8456]QQD84978.1 YitT family protein [Jeotgalicoccus sp. ATCC 8456]